MAGNDREPIGRKGKPTRPVKQKVSRRRYEDDDDYDDYDDYEDEEPMPRKGKGKGKGRKPRGKRGWLWLLLKLAIVFAVLIAIGWLSGSSALPLALLYLCAIVGLSLWIGKAIRRKWRK